MHMTGFTGHHEAPRSLTAQCLLERVAHPADTTSRSSAACGPLTIFSLKRSVKLDGVDHSAKDRLMVRTTIFITGRKPCAGTGVQHRYDGVRSHVTSWCVICSLCVLARRIVVISGSCRDRERV